MNELEKLESKRSDLAAQLESLQAEIDQKTQALGSDLLAGKDISKGADQLRRLENRCAVLVSAIGQADTKLTELRRVKAEEDRAAAIRKAQALDLEGSVSMARFVSLLIQAEEVAEEVDRLYSEQNNVSPVGVELQLGKLVKWLDYSNSRALRRLFLRHFEENRPEIFQQAQTLRAW